MAFFNLTHMGVQDPVRNSLKESSQASTSNLIATATPKTSSQYQGSHAVYTQRSIRHQRPSYAPNEIYRKPITASQELGWWINNNSERSLAWTKVERHVRVNSEMSRFVDEMALTDKHFSLF